MLPYHIDTQKVKYIQNSALIRLPRRSLVPTSFHPPCLIGVCARFYVTHSTYPIVVYDQLSVIRRKCLKRSAEKQFIDRRLYTFVAIDSLFDSQEGKN